MLSKVTIEQVCFISFSDEVNMLFQPYIHRMFCLSDVQQSAFVPLEVSQLIVYKIGAPKFVQMLRTKELVFK